MKIIPNKRRVRLNACPVGLFIMGDTLAMMTEYATLVDSNPVTPVRQRDAYIVESGEYFWGGTSDAIARGKLLVTPCTIK